MFSALYSSGMLFLAHFETWGDRWVSLQEPVDSYESRERFIKCVESKKSIMCLNYTILIRRSNTAQPTANSLHLLVQ